MKTVSKAQLKQWIDNRDDTLLINVLPEEKFNKRTIPGSVNVPLPDNDKFLDDVKAQRRSDNQRVVVFCASMQCNLSREAAARLEQAGVKNVYAFEEGVEGWFGKAESRAA